MRLPPDDAVSVSVLNFSGSLNIFRSGCLKIFYIIAINLIGRFADKIA